MLQAQSNFQRYEKKYLLNELQYRQLRQGLKEGFEVDQYQEATICNIYFDTPSHLLIRNSLEKPVYKEKLRLRSYGTPAEGDLVYAELKKKYKGVVYKRRVKMELEQAEQYLYERKPAEKSSQIIREIDYFMNFYQGMRPSMYISYQRIAMIGLENEDLRITFDRNLLWREEELWLECGAWGNSLLEEGQRLMEIKIPGVMPVWLSQLQNELKIYPTSFSKYGKGYERSLQEIKVETRKGDRLYA